MGKVTKIKWTDSTFSPWWGCQRVSPGCEHCYAETFSKRVGLKIWGPGDRRQFGDKHWKEPLRWEAAAKESGKRHLVFCASMADVFEDRRDLDAPRARLWALIRDTPHLTWLLLTKRPEHADRLWTDAYTASLDGGSFDFRARDIWQPNVWLGTTCEDQRRANERIPHLLDVPAVVRFLSCEPLIEAVKISDIVTPRGSARRLGVLKPLAGLWWATQDGKPGIHATPHGKIHWVIGGGESGPGARPCGVAWLRSLRDQCAAAGVPYFNKQLGSRAVDPDGTGWKLSKLVRVHPADPPGLLCLNDRKGGDPDEWPEDLRVMEWPR